MSLFKSANSTFVEALGKSHALVEIDADSTICKVSPRVVALTGYPLSEIVGRPLAAILGAGTAKQVLKEELRHSLRVATKAGTDLWLDIDYVPVSKDRTMLLMRDVTDSAKRSLDAHGKLAAISRSQAVIEFLPDGTIISANENFCRTLDYRLDEIVGRHHRMFCTPEYANGREYTTFWKRLADGESMSNEFLRIGKGGREVWIQASYNPIPDADGKICKVVKLATDVTERMVAIGKLGEGLKRMASGDLTTSLVKPFVPTMEALRHDFNQASTTLSRALSTVGQRSQTISDGARRMDTAATDLARRSEQQAASVEETAATLEEITTAVAQSSERAVDAAALATSTRDATDASLSVVDKAVVAMQAIQQSAADISNIVSVMDDIAFQTNLLALNAGVEAARAGDAGRGFAVVAQEVRALAQRSAASAKEIKALIGRSEREVTYGVASVNETGESIRGIARKITTIAVNLGEIVQSAKEQSAGVREVGNTVVRMDGVTQENATLAETTSAVSHDLSAEAEELFGLLSRFRLTEEHAQVRSKAA